MAHLRVHVKMHVHVRPRVRACEMRGCMWACVRMRTCTCGRVCDTSSIRRRYVMVGVFTGENVYIYN